MNFFVADRVRLAYRIDGPDDASTLVLLNSLGTDLRMWDPQVALLSSHLRIVRYDCRGHGASDVPSGPYTLEQLGHDLLALLDMLHLERSHICGLSLGGMVALWLALMYPDRVERAVFANMAARIGTVPLWQARIDAVNTGGMEAIRDAVLARFLSERFLRNHPEATRQIGEMIKQTNPKRYIGACAALRDADLRARLSDIRTPSLILVGALDEATPPSQAFELHGAITSSELVILHEACTGYLGHPFEKLEIYTRYLLSPFLLLPQREASAKQCEHRQANARFHGHRDASAIKQKDVSLLHSSKKGQQGTRPGFLA